MLAALGAPQRLGVLRDLPGWWHPGRSGALALGRVALARFGAIHPRVLRAFDLRGPAVAFTLDLAAIPQPRARGTARAPLMLHDLQAVERDFAFVVDARTEAQAVVQAALGADKALIEGVRVFDEFAGPAAEAQLGAGLKSLAISVRLQPATATLTEAEIEAVGRKIIDKVAKATGGALRG